MWLRLAHNDIFRDSHSCFHCYLVPFVFNILSALGGIAAVADVSIAIALSQPLYAYARDWNAYAGAEMNHNCTRSCAHSLSSLDQTIHSINMSMITVPTLCIIAGIGLIATTPL